MDSETSNGYGDECPLEGQHKKVLEVRGLSVTYFPSKGNAVHALDDVRLEIASGEILGILGESGCGKSTLANAILRLLPAHATAERGKIVFQARVLRELSESELREIRGRHISLVPQDPAVALNPVMKVGSQISEVLRAHFPLSAGERRERVSELLREVGFDPPSAIYQAYPHQLSGGQRQRIVLAQAIACRPALLIADEPTSKLDAPQRMEIVSLLSRIRQQHGTAILAISHDPALLAAFADRVAVMYAGEIVELGSCADVFTRPLHPYTQALMGLATSAVVGTAGLKSQFPGIEGEAPDPTNMQIGCHFAPRCSGRMDVCTQHCPQAVIAEPARSVSCFKYAD
jgi:peptide/nickel transport system ATP-binding protein